MRPELKIVKPSTEAEKATLSTTNTEMLSAAELRSWKVPQFQRPLTVNDRVVALSKQIQKDDGVIPGFITLGVLATEKDTRWIIDGQHRREAFFMSECTTAYLDVRVLHFKDMATMATEFKHLNSHLVNMRPDDHLRAMESSSEALAKIVRKCPYVGYGQVRRSDKAPILSMSSVLRCWAAGSRDVPQSGAGQGVASLAEQLTVDEADHLISYLDVAYNAWGRDHGNYRLWGSLTLALTMWLYRRTVMALGVGAGSKSTKISRELFGKCMLALSADSHYADWLVGRQLNDRDRSPAYNKIKYTFVKRIEIETGETGKVKLIQPAWASSGGHKDRRGG